MEKIYRKISLETLKTRQISSLPSLSDGGDIVFSGNSWGHIAYDLVMTGFTLDNINAYKVKNGDEFKNNVIRYREFWYIYSFLLEIIKNTVAYERCETRWKKINKVFLEEDWVLLSDYPEDLSIKYFYLNENASVFYTYFGNYDDNAYENARKFQTTIEKYLINDIDEQLLSIPFVSVKLNLTEEISDLGLMIPYVKEWKFKTYYYVGDKVIYDGKIYELIDGDSEVEVTYPNSLDTNTVKRYCGRYENGVVVTPDNDNKFWKIVEPESVTSGNTVSQTTTNSMLRTFKRRKVTRNNSGETLSFIYDNGKAFLPFMMGRINTELSYKNKNDNNIYTCDFLKRITTDNGYEKVYSDAEYDIEITGDMSGATTFIFEYYIGAQFENKGGEKLEMLENTGIFYTEYVPCTFKDDIIVFEDGTQYKNGYIDFKYDLSVTEKSYDLSETEKIDKIEVVRDETLIGIQNIREIKEDYRVVRGTSAVNERLNALSEVKSMGDLENYRNNLFKV